MISVKIVADSITSNKDRLTTLEVIMPRYILAEFNTHRVFTRNSASSRAIRLSKMVASVLTNCFIPMAFQKDHTGMQGSEYIDPLWEFTLEDFMDKAKEFFGSENKEEDKELKLIWAVLLNNPTYKISRTLEEWWLFARDKAVEVASLMNIFGLSKQICNRLLEPFMYHKVLVSATEWENFFNLRCPDYVFHDENQEYHFKSKKDVIQKFDENEPVEYLTDNVALRSLTTLQWLELNKGQADIHMMAVAEAIYDAINESKPTQLKEGEWHIPYGNNFSFGTLVNLGIRNQLLENKEDLDKYYNVDDERIIDELARKISIVRCARVSYHIVGQEQIINYDADLKLYNKLAKSGHWSPFEHVAKVMTTEEYEIYSRIEVILDNNGTPFGHYENGWCRNFKGFIQYRAMMDNES